VWVPGIALAWDLTTTMTASWQKVFSGDPKIGYFEQRSVYQSALDDGKLLPPATTTDQMHQIITNSTTNGVLQALFALLTLIVVASAIPVWVKAAKRGGLPTTEAPYEPSRLVAPSDFFATKEEKAAVREYEESQRELAGSGGR
jgi:carbon starvation protein